jgi:IclR family transcriptional regulator, pca regulon regulatory protein
MSSAIIVQLIDNETGCDRNDMAGLIDATAPPTLAPHSDGEIMGGFLKGLAVIEAFGGERSRLTIAEAAKAAGLDRAAARRCLLTLVRLGYAGIEGKHFHLTPRILRLGFAYLSATPLPRLVQPYLERLSAELNESCSVSVLDGADIVYVARAAQARVLSIGLNVGSRLPAYCASMGRVLLANRPEEEARRLLEASERRKLTPKTLTDLDDLMAELARIRRDGYCIIDEELELGLRSAAVPVRSMRGELVGAMNVGAQAARAAVERIRTEFVPALLATQAEIARSLP